MNNLGHEAQLIETFTPLAGLAVARVTGPMRKHM
jgi:hypothetical protein